MQFHLTQDRTRHWLISLAAGIALAIAGSASIAFVHPAVPFAIIVGVLLLITYVPELVTWLPSKLMGGPR